MLVTPSSILLMGITLAYDRHGGLCRGIHGGGTQFVPDAKKARSCPLFALVPLLSRGGMVPLLGPESSLTACFCSTFGTDRPANLVERWLHGRKFARTYYSYLYQTPAGATKVGKATTKKRCGGQSKTEGQRA